VSIQAEGDVTPAFAFTSEREIEDRWCRYLDSQGVAYRRQVTTPCGRADIVTEEAVYEVKLLLTRGALFKAVGQVTLYAAALNKRRRVIVGVAIDADWFEAIRGVLWSHGIFVNWQGERLAQ
jgi:hypothetical protein